MDAQDGQDWIDALLYSYPTPTIPFILFIHANCSPSTKGVHVNALAACIHIGTVPAGPGFATAS